MSRALLLLLLCVALALGGILYLEASSGPSGADAGLPGGGRVAEVVRPGQRAPAENAAPWVATILARPLFSPTRRPPAPGAAPAKAAVAEMPRLTGVLITDAASGAMFARPGERPIVVHTGDRIGPYQVTSISAGQVTLTGPAGPVTMHPAFAKAAERQATAPGAPPEGKSSRPRLAPAPAAATQAEIPSLAEVQHMIAKQQAEMAK